MYSNWKTKNPDSLQTNDTPSNLNIYQRNFCDFHVPHLVDVVEFEVFEEQQEEPRDRLDDDLLVAIHVDTQLHRLQHGGAETRKWHLRTRPRFARNL